MKVEFGGLTHTIYYLEDNKYLIQSGNCSDTDTDEIVTETLNEDWYPELIILVKAAIDEDKKLRVEQKEELEFLGILRDVGLRDWSGYDTALRRLHNDLEIEIY